MKIAWTTAYRLHSRWSERFELTNHLAGRLQNWGNIRHFRFWRLKHPISPLLQFSHASLFLRTALWTPVLIENTASGATWLVTRESSKWPLGNWSRTCLLRFAVTSLKVGNLRSPGGTFNKLLSGCSTPTASSPPSNNFLHHSRICCRHTNYFTWNVHLIHPMTLRAVIDNHWEEMACKFRGYNILGRQMLVWVQVNGKIVSQIFVFLFVWCVHLSIIVCL